MLAYFKNISEFFFGLLKRIENEENKDEGDIRDLIERNLKMIDEKSSLKKIFNLKNIEECEITED